MNFFQISSSRVLISKDPFLAKNKKLARGKRGYWPAHWICYSDESATPIVTAYRRKFHLDTPATIRLHVSADERYILYIDGKSIGRGPERGAPHHWFYETYEMNFSAGEHTIVAQVWSLGKLAPHAQLALKHGFLLATEKPYGDLLNTGVSKWDTKKLAGYSFVYNPISWGAGPDQTTDANTFDWNFVNGEGKNWLPANIGLPAANGELFEDYRIEGHRLFPATLPPILEQDISPGKVRHVEIITTHETWKVKVQQENNLVDEVNKWNALLATQTPLTVPANTTIRAIIDLQNYYCAYPQLVTSNGANTVIRINWAESLFEKSQENQENNPKGNRNEIKDKYFIGVGDTFKADGGRNRQYETLWWRAGRYMELLIQTFDQPLTIENLSLRETRYPLELESKFSASDNNFDKCWPIMVRSMQMCSHETYMDCPYYEQLMYIGDTRLEALTTYCMTNDDALPQKAILTFRHSLLTNGITPARYPARLLQAIPPFSLWWIAMIYDHALWRGDKIFIKQMMPGVRSVIEAFLSGRNSNGLVVFPKGWNFTDWVCDDTGQPLWDRGVPPYGKDEISGLFNWQMAMILRMMSELEQWLGEDELAMRADRISKKIADAAIRTFWDEDKALFADDTSQKYFSEHTQCLAVLSGLLNESHCKRISRSLFNTPDIARATIYFSHYLFETCRKLNRIDKMFERLNLWFKLPAAGLKTTFETPGNTRSDCHAWGAHPIYHCFATILGIRPAKFGFSSVQISPQLGPLTEISGTLPHPLGKISVKAKRNENLLDCDIILPDNLHGQLGTSGQKLQPSYQKIRIHSEKHYQS